MNVIFKDDSIGGRRPPNGSDGGRTWYERLASRGFMGTEVTGVMTLLVHRYDLGTTTMGEMLCRPTHTCKSPWSRYVDRYRLAAGWRTACINKKSPYGGGFFLPAKTAMNALGAPSSRRWGTTTNVVVTLDGKTSIPRRQRRRRRLGVAAVVVQVKS